MQTIQSFIKRERFFLAALGLAVVIGAAMNFGGGKAALPAVAAGGDPIYMKIEGIDGEVADRGHEKEIHLESWSWGMSQTGGGAGGAGRAGKVSVNDLAITKNVDKSSPDLMLACASGKHFNEIILTMRKPGGEQDYLKYSFFDVFCDAYQVGGTASDPLPTESISFNFTKVIVEYKEQKPDGDLGAPERAGWDFKQGKEVVMPAAPSSPSTDS